MSTPTGLLGSRPDTDPIERERLRAELRARMLGETPRAPKLGRYEVLELAGEGAMGAVYAARDPQLGRRVAIKVVTAAQRDDDQAKARLVREAQALAKLSHPNIVTVFDAGSAHDQVWIAMEFVTGQTLRQWLDERARPWAEVLPALLDAAAGLSAAHDQGVVHRDFKPGNVMVDDEGRWRVTDFGLATTDAVDSTSPLRLDRGARQAWRSTGIAGTHGYIAPEVLDGLRADARADQFAFCVTALGSLVDPPPRLSRVLRRGIRDDPAQRWPTMALLIARLRDEARPTGARRRWLVLAAMGSTATVVALANWPSTEHVDADAGCRAEASPVDDVWNPQRRQRVSAGIVASNVSYAETTAARVVATIDAYAAAWGENRQALCRDAHHDADWNPTVVDRATWCLDERLGELDALLGAYEDLDAAHVRQAVLFATVLPSVTACRDLGYVEQRAPPPLPDRRAIIEARHGLTRAHMAAAARRTDEAEQLVEALSKRVDALQWPPLARAVQNSRARVAVASGKRDEGEEIASTTYFDAAQAADWDAAAEAAVIILSMLAAREDRDVDARQWAEFAETALDRSGSPPGHREMVRLSSLGVVLRNSGEFAAATALHRKALTLAESLYGANGPRVAIPLNNLAVLRRDVGDLEQARILYERSLTMREGALGPDHPDVAISLSNLGNLLYEEGKLDEAIAMQTRAVAVQEQAFGPDHLDVGRACINLGVVLAAHGDTERAQGYYRRALVIFETGLGPDHPWVAAALQNLGTQASIAGDHAGARAKLERALGIVEGMYGPEHPEIARLLVNLGTAASARGETTAAIEHMQRAVDIRTKLLGADNPLTLAAQVNLDAVRSADG